MLMKVMTSRIATPSKYFSLLTLSCNFRDCIRQTLQHWQRWNAPGRDDRFWAKPSFGEPGLND